MSEEELKAIEERFGHNGPLPYGDLRDGHALIAEVRRITALLTLATKVIEDARHK